MNAPDRSNIDPRAEAILTFWLTADRSDAAAVLDAKMSTWFRGGDEVDRAVRRQFGDNVGRASAGELDSWGKDAHNRLALIILLDQFRRNLYRDQAKMVALDDKAMALTLEGEENGQLEQLTPIEQVFFMMPHQHSEDLAVQDDGVARFEALAERMKDAPGSVSKLFANFADYAHQHRDIIARFGRFPHRNAILGRDSTEEEAAWLADDAPTFGQGG